MYKVFLAGSVVFGVITYALTIYYAFLNWGFWWALAAFVFPPLDLIFMFMLGTWQWGLIALGCYGLAVITMKDK